MCTGVGFVGTGACTVVGCGCGCRSVHRYRVSWCRHVHGCRHVHRYRVHGCGRVRG